MHFINTKGYNKKFNGQTLLASASTKGVPGNGDSGQPSFARAGKAVVFTAVIVFLQFRPNGLVSFRTRGLVA